MSEHMPKLARLQPRIPMLNTRFGRTDGPAPNEAERKRRVDQLRGSSHTRGYDADWRKLRVQKLQTDPLCECDDCQAGKLRITMATVVDHRISIVERPDLRLEWSNLRSMSKPCHDRRTARDQGFARKGGNI